MNSLSWLLYAADVFGGVRLFALIFGVVFTLTCAGSTLVWFAVMDDSLAQAEREKVSKWMSRVWRVFLPSTVACALLFIVTPRHETMMLIAASEVGETVLSSEAAQEIGGEAGALATDSLRVLRKFINEQLGEDAE